MDHHARIGGSMESVRIRFLKELLAPLHIVWPVFSGLLVVMLGLGLAVSHFEGWHPLAGLYFACVTGMTVGYGDLVPTHPVSRILAIGIGFVGIMLTALLAAIAVRALQVVAHETHTTKHTPNRDS